MIDFILNNQNVSTDQLSGSTVLDFVRYHKNLKGTKIGCREGDCGACTVLVGELVEGEVKYRTMTSCLMPLANAAGKHIVTVEGINPAGRGMTPVQQAMVDESGTQCGFCTVGFVISLTGFCLDAVRSPRVSSPHVSKGNNALVNKTNTDSELTNAAISAMDGNICRCTGYKSIERAAENVCRQLAEGGKQFVPEYFNGITTRLSQLQPSDRQPITDNRLLPFVGGGTDLYVQRHDEMADSESEHVLFDDNLRGIRDTGTHIEIGASATVTDLMVSPVMQAIFPDLYKHLKLVSSTPIRNMATLAGNFVNASPIGDMTVWFLALDAEIELATLEGRNASVNERAVAGENANENEGTLSGEGTLVHTRVSSRTLTLRELYQGYKHLAKSENEQITTIRFRKPTGDFRFNFEKVCKRTYLDIATVNTAISLRVSIPSVSSPHVSKGLDEGDGALTYVRATDNITEAHIAVGGVSPIPLYLKETSSFLNGKTINEETITAANEIMQSEISPISDVRGTEAYKRLLLRQLFTAHFVELFDV